MRDFAGAFVAPAGFVVIDACAAPVAEADGCAAAVVLVLCCELPLELEVCAKDDPHESADITRTIISRAVFIISIFLAEPPAA